MDQETLLKIQECLLSDYYITARANREEFTLMSHDNMFTSMQIDAIIKLGYQLKLFVANNHLNNSYILFGIDHNINNEYRIKKVDYDKLNDKHEKFVKDVKILLKNIDNEIFDFQDENVEVLEIE